MEKINNIEISNFKSIKHLKIDGCNTINVFIGQPNAGKSNILEALGIFGMLDYGKYSLSDFVRFNNSYELFFEGNISKKIHLLVNDVSLYIEKVNSKSDNIDDLHYFGPNEELKYYFNVKDIIKNNFQHEIDSNSKICPLKKYQYNQKENNSHYNSNNLDFPFGDNISQVIFSTPELRKEIKSIFEQNNLKVLIDKNSNELLVFNEYQDGTVFTLPYNLIADTLQRLIFYKAAIMSNENTVLLFEEPEAHCFEPYILEFTNSVKYDKRDNQFFIVTHSDFIIQEFLRDEESKQNTNIYLVNNVDGETKVKLLDKKKNDDVYEYGMNAFFNFESLWENN